jgi:hypothetical protein
VNSHLFKAKDGLKNVDILSWHDYHAGWLADANTIKRFRQNLDESGGKHVAIWFNEGWAFTNTAVNEPSACTGLTAAESTNAIMASVAEMTVAGQEKTVLFHTGYETHGMSFWDYSGPGTMLWDWYGNPLPLVAAWNVMAHHTSLSEPIGLIRPPGCNLAVFQDLRNNRGVIVAYADRGAKEDIAFLAPLPLQREDIMGNPMDPSDPANHTNPTILSKTGRLIYLYDGKTTGKELYAALEKLDRKHQSFVSQGSGEKSPVFRLPPAWEGKAKDSTEGSTATANGEPVWRLVQVWPPETGRAENFRAMTWTGTAWNVSEGGFGGQPGAELKDGALLLSTRAAHGNPPQRRLCGLTFVVPADGKWTLRGTASSKIWDGKNTTKLRLLRKLRAGDGVSDCGHVMIPHEGSASLDTLSAEAKAGDELVLLPEIDGMFAGGTTALRDFSIGQGGGAPTGTVFSLPAAWEGITKGKADGNPATANGKPVWALYRLWPADHKMAANWTPMVWQGTRWAAPDHTHAGHPSATIEGGTLNLAAMGPWAGDLEFQKIPGLAFIAPVDGSYRITATASCKLWEGGAKSLRLALFKEDTQRAAEIAALDLPRDGETRQLDQTVALSAGHELILAPVMSDYHNAANFRIADLKVEKAP